jgi:putative ubiquitin-RnfH superfamily antitoxin RatB of RatAB toxin-antitoxin module
VVTPAQKSRVNAQVVALAGGLSFIKNIVVPQGQTLAWAVNASGLYALHPHLREAPLGVWGKVLSPSALVQEADRIEVYTPVAPETLAAHRTRLRESKQSAKVPQ